MDNELKVPNHIAIILDGNGRWAKKRNMPRGYGHIVGCDNLEKMCDVIKDMGVKYLTVYAFSTENWKRSRAEVEGLLKLFRQYLKRCIKKAHKNQMRVKIIGDPSAFPQDIQDSIHELEECSKDYDHMYFQIAMNYGSRDEILRGMTRMIEDVKNGTLAENAFDENGKLTEQCFESYLDTAGIPGSRSSDPYKRRAAPFQLPDVAAGLHGILLYRGSVAGFPRRGIEKSHRTI